MSIASSVREATHAGSWYTKSGKKLREELQANLDRVTVNPELDYDPPVRDAKAIIGPHAGYAYSGPAAAWAYAAIPSAKIKRIILLGPSHHANINGVALSPFSAYGTPLGQIPLDNEVLDELEATRLFQAIPPHVDEDEHSLEMHLPYIRHIFADRDDMKLVPLIVGHEGRDPSAISRVLEKYWKDDESFFIISSDFCHWGTRFRHTPYYPEAPSPTRAVPPLNESSSSVSRSSGSLSAQSPGAASPLSFQKSLTKLNPSTPIYKSIQYMDHEAIEILRRPAEKGTVEKWHAYLDRTHNTICGRNPITVLLRLIAHIYGNSSPEHQPTFTFVRYEMSEEVVDPRGSSVSYVSGVLRVPP